ncbi:MAG: TolC family protein [Planctomycetaceae bacterium]|nr:TolC family protein [Planctomycetales bacterium]MCB9927351.1 TolC family protein [Planctomycetaceae bacterium]
MGFGINRLMVCALAALLAWSAKFTYAQRAFPFVFPEQRSIQVRDPSELRPARIPNTPPPPTVSNREELAPRHLTLDEAIRTALANSEVVRVLNGVAASSTGQTIYDVAIQNAGIDEANAVFDPTASVNNSFNRIDRPSNSNGTAIIGNRGDNYNLDFDLNKKIVTGGTLNLGVNATPSKQSQDPFIFQNPTFLNPRTNSSAELSITQPMLRGGGRATNLAPIVLARIETERSYFQLKSSVQALVRSVIEGYWGVVFARTDVWARRQQEKQSKGALDLAEARLRAGLVDLADVAQARLAYHNFRASLITAEANLLQREAAMLNVLGFPPYESERFVPVTPPQQERVAPDWSALLLLAQERRPDLIELKLILEADEQRILQARNQALPQVDAVALYRWNGLEGELPIGTTLSSRPGQFTDWTLAVNFSVPLGLRQSRANLRRQELVISRDLANLDQGVHAASHIIAGNLRNLAQYYEQYEAYHAARDAAETNLRAQYAEYRSGRTILLNLLQGITDWGNAVSAEAQALLQYNIELANLEQQTGTILETHGVRFYEERFNAIGPLGRLGHGRSYAGSTPPDLNLDRYPTGDRPSEEVFDLETPEFPSRRRASPVIEPLPVP